MALDQPVVEGRAGLLLAEEAPDSSPVFEA